jgi:hypothetical protein
MVQNINESAEKMRKQADKKRIVGLTFEEGDKVYLSRANLRTKKPSNKLDSLRISPFKVLAKTGPVNYKLELLALMKIHPVFHVKLLEPAPQEVQTVEEPKL